MRSIYLTQVRGKITTVNIYKSIRSSEIMIRTAMIVKTIQIRLLHLPVEHQKYFNFIL